MRSTARMTSPVRRLLTLGRRRRGPEPTCSVCDEPLAGLPSLRIRGMPLHRDCVGYRARQLMRG